MSVSLSSSSSISSLSQGIPGRLTPFVGRTAELAEIERIFLADPHCRLLTILGPGGIGKSRLALEVGARATARFADGVHFVPLAPLRTADQVLGTVAESLAMRFYDVDDPGRQLLEFLHEKRLLLIMDNFEHVLAGAELVAQILEAAPGVKVLVTSRERLNLTSETIFPLRGMRYPQGRGEGAESLKQYEAVNLLVQRAQARRHDYQPDPAELATMARIARLVQGMPLALVLAGAWLDILSLEEIAAEIERSSDILETQMRDLPPRQRSMRAVFDSSWQQLSAEEQGVLARLSLFRGGFTRPAAQAVAAAGLWTLRALASKSLLAVDGGERYEVHELLRQYAAEQLGADEAALRERHSNYYLDFLQARYKDLIGGRQVGAMQEIAAELENVRAAWQWALAHGRVVQAVQATAGTLTLYHQFRSLYLEALQLFEQAAQLLEAEPPSRERDVALLRVHLPLSWFNLRFGRLEAVRAVALQSEQIYERLGIPYLQGYATDPAAMLSFAASTRGDHETAWYYAARMQRDAEAQDHIGNRQFAYYRLAQVALARGDVETAQENADRAYTIVRERQDEWFAAYCLNLLGDVALARPDHDAARQYYQRSLEIRQQFGDREGIALALTRLAEVDRQLNNCAAAADFYEQARLLYEQINDRGGLATALYGLGVTAFALEDRPAAERYYQQALQIAARIQYTPVMLAVLAGVGRLFLSTGREAQGAALLAFVRDEPATVAQLREEVTQVLAEREEAEPAQGSLQEVVSALLFEWAAGQ